MVEVHTSRWYATDPTVLDEDGAKSAIERTFTNTKGSALARQLVGDAETEVANAPSSAFAFDERGYATLRAAGRSFDAGHFSTPTLGELRARLPPATQGASRRVRLSIIEGNHALTDIGMLQATAPEGVLFQVASQFNCLEAPDSAIVPVVEYLGDPTQGPRASVSAFPGTLLRHYRALAPDGSRFAQTNDRCINLLADVVPDGAARVVSGYLLSNEIRDVEAFAEALVRDFDRVRVGVHDGVEVVFGHGWGGLVASPAPRIAQVLTSTLALGYSRDDGSAALATVRRQLLRGAYMGTLLAAAALGKRTVVLTLIGGGVFDPHADIWEAIHFAVEELEPLVDREIDVVVNARTSPAESVRERVRARGGFVAELGSRSVIR